MNKKLVLGIALIVAVLGLVIAMIIKSTFRTLSPVPDENAVKVLIVSPPITK